MSSDPNSVEFDYNDYIFDNDIETPEPAVLITTIGVRQGNVSIILEMIEEQLFTGETLVTMTIEIIEHQPSVLDLLANFNEMARREIGALDVESILEDIERSDFGSNRTVNDLIQDYETSTARLKAAQAGRAPRITSERRNSQNLKSKFAPTYEGNTLEIRDLLKNNQYLSHPERQRDELFLTNGSRFDHEHRCGRKTKRIGRQAYYALCAGELAGQPITFPNFYPLFIKKSEILQQLQDEPESARYLDSEIVAAARSNM